MKRIFHLCCVTLFAITGFSIAKAQDNAAPQKQLKVLMIGNSFSASVLGMLPEIVKKDPTSQLLLVNAFIGGCTIERHLAEYDAAIKDPTHRPYSTNYKIKGREKKTPKSVNWPTNVPELLKLEKWDIITIQQGSSHSWRAETYGKDADRLISIIRETNPQAEIVVHETWSYRVDAPRLAEWGISQQEMTEKVSAAYKELAKRYNFRLIPVGDAVEIYRKNEQHPFKPLSKEELANVRWPDLPANGGDVVGAYRFTKNAETGKMTFGADNIHLNDRGRYLQACVWYMFLFNKKADDIKYEPDTMDREYCKMLAKCAEEAVYGNK